jgi:uncharacterized membrane protein
MVNTRTALVAIVGFLMLVAGLSIWVLGDQTSSMIPLSMASTGVLWAPLLWISGIIVILSAALAGLLQVKDFMIWLATLIVGYIAVFAVLVLIASHLLP